MRTPIDKESVLAEMDLEIGKLPKKGLDADRALARLKIYVNYSDRLRAMTTKALIAGKHGLANTTYSGAKGSPAQLNSMITTPALYTDYKDKPIPIFIRRSFGEGLRPYEYLASMFGARKAIISTKEATADAGDLGKQMAQAAITQVVTQHECTCSNGIAVELDDLNDILGRVTVREYKGIPAGTAIDKRVVGALGKQKIKKVLVKSPLTCKAKMGVCAEAGGVMSNGKFPAVGDSVGLTAAQALAEPLAQGSLNVKHSGGIFSGKKTFSGFSVINQIMQSPSTFPNRAAVSEVHGRVDKIEEAPQGGSYITIAGEKHYTLPGFDLTVKEGDSVEPGDQLSDGIVDVKDIIRLRGLGAGRMQYVNRLQQAFEDSGIGVSRRNLEYFARAALDHVKIESLDGMGDYLPDDVASYNSLVNSYQPPESSKMIDTKSSTNQYLEAPALHYTIGTQITPKIKKDLADNGIDKIFTSDKKPEFTPLHVYLRRSKRYSDDWMAKLHTSYIADSLKTDAFRGADTDIEQNIHFAPRLAIGKGFGEKIENTGQF
jgi:DNA-directed RNA polymerase subunit beta'